VKHVNVPARIGMLTSSEEIERAAILFFSTLRESYVTHVLGSGFVRKSRMYVLKMRTLFRRSFLPVYSSDAISAISRFGFTNRTY
jgi:hypothetical protein